MAYIIDRKHQYIVSTDSVGEGFITPPLSGVKAGDFLLFMWATNDDDKMILDNSGWSEITDTDPLSSLCEARAYYKFATTDNEQITPWSCEATLNFYLETMCIRGIDSSNPIIMGASYSSGSSKTANITYPSLTSTADKQLCFWLSSSDASPITEGTHTNIIKLQGDNGVSDSFFYQYVTNGIETISAFTDSISPTDQACSLGFILKDAAESPAPLEVTPLKSLEQIIPDTNNDSNWMEAIYASGCDIETGIVRVVKTPTFTCYSTSGQWMFKIDRASTMQNCVQGDTVTFASGATASFAYYNQNSTSGGGRGYMCVYDYTGTGEGDNSACSSGSYTGQMWGTGTANQYDLTGLVHSTIAIKNYKNFKVSGYSSIGLTDDEVYWFRDVSNADSSNEGYFYEIRTHASRYDEGTVIIPTAGAGTGTLNPYNMCNLEYTVDTENQYPNEANGQTGWKTSIMGSCRSFSTSRDMSGKLIALWNQTNNTTTAYVYYLMIDTSNNFKIWKLRSKYDSNNIYNATVHNLISPDSTETPFTQTSSFNSNAIKYHGIMFRASSDTSKNGITTYNQYIVNTQTIEGGGSTKEVTYKDIALFLNSEKTLSNISYTESLQSIVPSQFMLSRSLILACKIRMDNQALSFPPQADGINNFLFNVDAGFCGLETNGASGKITNSLIASDVNSYWDSSADTIDYSGSIFSSFNVTLDVDRTYENESWVNCGTIALNNGASLDNCTINGSTDNYGCSLDIADAPIVSDTAIKNCSDYGMLIAGTGDITFDNVTFSGNTTKDIYFSATTGTINLTTNTAGITYDSAGATINIIAPTTTLTVTGIADNTEVRVYKESDDTELIGIENSTGGSFSADCSYVGNIYIVVHHLDYQYIRIEYTLAGINAIIPVQQQADSTYRNP